MYVRVHASEVMLRTSTAPEWCCTRPPPRPALPPRLPPLFSPQELEELADEQVHDLLHEIKQQQGKRAAAAAVSASALVEFDRAVDSRAVALAALGFFVADDPHGVLLRNVFSTATLTVEAGFDPKSVLPTVDTTSLPDATSTEFGYCA